MSLHLHDKIIWTIGHSTRSLEEFISILQSFKIELLADIRNYPGSRRYPHFNKEELEKSLEQSGIEYIHMKVLGGRRKPAKDSVNTRWRNEAFRGYADYMETADFKDTAATLEKMALTRRVAYMCSEAVWWSCHRALVSDWLKIRGWKVMHIMAMNKADEHPFTSAARIENGVLRYDEPGLFRHSGEPNADL
jgi:uncharacterized protein (DUF488 family)